MGKKICNRADEMAFHALQKALEQEKMKLCLLESKINRPTSPVYNPWEVLLPMLVPTILGLILIMSVGPIFGLVFMVAAIFAVSNLVKKKLDSRLYERSKNFLTSSYENFNKLWDFGGIVLVNSANQKQACISPEADWKDFVIQNFADLMVDKPEAQQQETPQEEVKDETPRPRRRSRRG